jgi:hypothetical protein
MTRITIRRCPVCPEKRVVATRLARALREEDGAEVELVWGGLGELSVWSEGRALVRTNRFWFSRTRDLLERVRAGVRGARAG